MIDIADPGRRLLARLIDTAIVSAASGGMLLLVFLGTWLAEDFSAGPFIWSMLFTLAFAVAYETVLTAQYGQTVGKRVMGLRVVNAETGNIPSGTDSFLRFLIPNLAGLIPFGSVVTYASILWGKRGQGWHDMVAKTYVVNV